MPLHTFIGASQYKWGTLSDEEQRSKYAIKNVHRGVSNARELIGSRLKY